MRLCEEKEGGEVIFCILESGFEFLRLRRILLLLVVFHFSLSSPDSSLITGRLPLPLFSLSILPFFSSKASSQIQ